MGKFSFEKSGFQGGELGESNPTSETFNPRLMQAADVQRIEKENQDYTLALEKLRENNCGKLAGHLEGFTHDQREKLGSALNEIGSSWHVFSFVSGSGQDAFISAVDEVVAAQDMTASDRAKGQLDNIIYDL